MAAERENKIIINSDEIDLVELIRSIWLDRRFIFKISALFGLVGLIIAYISPIEYQASCKLLPESQESKTQGLGGLAGLAGLAGVNLGAMSNSTSGGLTPQLYPEIVNSLPFILEVLNDTIYFEKLDQRTTSLEYFKKNTNSSPLQVIQKYTIGLPDLIKKSFQEEKEENLNKRNIPFFRLTRDEWTIIEDFKKRLMIKIDDDTGIVQVTAEMPDPYASAQIAQKVELMITDAVISYKTNKSKNNLLFIQQTHDEAKTNFEKIQLKFAKISDRNRSVHSATAQIELKRIENEYEIAFEVYKGLASQVEQAKIQLKEKTPVFTVLEPVRIPEYRIKPRRKIITLAATILGCILATSFLATKKLFTR